MSEADPKEQPKKVEEAKAERLLRRMLEGMGAVLDRGLGRDPSLVGGALTTSKLIQRMKALIDERVRDYGRQGRIAPHHLRLKVEWGTHSEAAPESVKELEHEILAAAIDHINDSRYRTLAPVQIETVIDIFTTGISIDPTYGEYEESLRRQDEAAAGKHEEAPAAPAFPMASERTILPEEQVMARVTAPNGKREALLAFRPGGRHLSVGRASDNDLSLNHPSVSKVHATIVMNRQGTLLVADTGSTNGTYINGRRIAYGEARQIDDGDVVGFGDVEVRLQRTSA